MKLRRSVSGPGFHAASLAGPLAVSIAATISLSWGGWVGQEEQEGVSDTAVTDAVETELAHDPAVSPARLDVHTDGGIVTLEGRALSLLEKNRAERIAETVRGVRSVINLVQVRPSGALPDEAIREEVEKAFLADPAIDASEVEVSVENGITTLSGSVDSWAERSLLVKATGSVRGVTEIVDRIDVDPPEDRPAAEIEEEVRQTLRWDVLVDHGLIRVGVEKDTVVLEGLVASAAEKRRARYDAFVSGVTAVDDSRLEVARWTRDDEFRAGKYEPVTDEEVERALETAFLQDPRVRAAQVLPDVEGGVATLRGQVDNLKARRAAGDVARSTVGVESVVNGLEVRPESPPADAQVARTVDEALLRDPFVDAGEIITVVEGGVVTLAGSVDSRFEKAQADEVASRVRGVLEVENYLEVPEEGPPYVGNPYVEDFDTRSLVLYRFRPFQTRLSDAAIENAIENEFFWSPFVDGDDVNVIVNDGVATLTGTVDSLAERHDATENAYEGGAVKVNNELIVR